MKIAIGGIASENCTFSSLLSREEDFMVLRGEDLLARYPFMQSNQGVSSIPLMYARALPGAPVEAGFYGRVKKEFLQKLEENGPVDGLFLHMHGAVYVEGMEDAEGDFIAAARKIVGKNCIIAASYDLHGNVSARVMQNVDILSAYRTAPHVDVPETLERAYGLLIKCLTQGIRPYKAFIPVPILLSGEQTSTEWEPGTSLYRQIPEVISNYGLLDASILIGYVWADEPRSTACVTAFGMDQAKVELAARYLAQKFWDVRHLFRFGTTAAGVDECIQIAMGSTEHPIVISDSGDNPTAGGAGDTPFMVERMLALGVKDAVFASIADPEAVRKCEAAGAEAIVELSLGGKLDAIHVKPLVVKVQVKSLHVVPWALNRQGDYTIMNHIAVVAERVQGILIIIAERRTPFHHISDFTNLGIDPHQHKIVVVKIGFLEPELKTLAAKSLLALSPGTVDQNTVEKKYYKIHRPMFPFDKDFDWAP
jgi:microcystin degradation protein MlrC